MIPLQGLAQGSHDMNPFLAFLSRPRPSGRCMMTKGTKDFFPKSVP